MNGVLYFPVGDKNGINELEEICQVLQQWAVFTTYTFDHLRKYKDFTGKKSLKDKADQGQKGLFSSCVLSFAYSV